MFTFNHYNFNVSDLEKSIKFYDEALGLRPVREVVREGYKLVFLGDGTTDFCLELTSLFDRTEPYDLGEGEFHLALTADDIDAAYAKHKEMGIVCQEQKAGHKFYFIEDPDGYWVEIVEKK